MSTHNICFHQEKKTKKNNSTSWKKKVPYQKLCTGHYVESLMHYILYAVTPCRFSAMFDMHFASSKGTILFLRF